MDGVDGALWTRASQYCGQLRSLFPVPNFQMAVLGPGFGKKKLEISLVCGGGWSQLAAMLQCWQRRSSCLGVGRSALGLNGLLGAALLVDVSPWYSCHLAERCIHGIHASDGQGSRMQKPHSPRMPDNPNDVFGEAMRWSWWIRSGTFGPAGKKEPAQWLGRY
jgi:hypothetical protein